MMYGYFSSPLLVTPEGQLSVACESMCTNTGKVLRGPSLPMKSMIRLTDRLNITCTALSRPKTPTRTNKQIHTTY